jgi:hypothetical protein
MKSTAFIVVMLAIVLVGGEISNKVEVQKGDIAVIAHVCFSTNITEILHPSGNQKVRTEIAVATVIVPGYLTNTVMLSTNRTVLEWRPVPTGRRPLEAKNFLLPNPSLFATNQP